MPLAIRDYTWDETENAVFITVPLKGVKSHNVNIFSTEEYIKLEEQERSRIEQIKQDEIKKATDDLEKWKEEQKQLAEQEKQRIIEEQKAADAALREERKKNERKNKRNKSAMIFEETAGGVPKREVGKIEVSFTSRVFPTPVRESQTPQEEEWLKKQAESRKIIELQDKDLTEEERNPMFLRDKGNGFFQAGNYQSAINAYTHALRLNPKMHGLYSNRAACHLKLRNFFKCIEDCSKAMDLLQPPVPQNAASRVKALVRKGTAFCELEMYVEGLQDYEAALKIDPNNEQLKADAERIRQVIQSSSGS